MHPDGSLCFKMDGYGSVTESSRPGTVSLQHSDYYIHKPLDLLIRSKQVSDVSADLVRTGRWIEVPLVPFYTEDYLQPPPRIFKRTDDTFSIKIWTEDAVFLLVDLPAKPVDTNRPFLIQTPCCEPLNSVLLESDMHPSPEIVTQRPRLLSTPNIRFLPHILCQSVNRQPQTKVYIPTIARYLDALLAQIRWLQENGYGKVGFYGPRVDVSYLVRYLFLSERKKLLPLLKSESVSQMVEIVDRYKRTQKFRHEFKDYVPNKDLVVTVWED